MNAEMNFEMNFARNNREERENVKKNDNANIVAENCNCSVYSMVTVAGGVLMAIGAVIYSLIAM
ncbi:MAG: hypothetical protein IJZ83_00755 [Clostridia bacterium]|nr:hypothetical protein [Clostridia bacterium]